MWWKCYTQYVSKFGKLSSGHRTGKGQFSFQSQRKIMPNNPQTTAQLYSSHTLVKQCSKFSKPGFSNLWTMNFQMFKVVFRKGRGIRDQITNIPWIIEKARVPEKHLLLLYWVHQSLSLCRLQITEIFFKKWEYKITLPASWEICMQVKKQQWELDMKQQAGSKLGKEYFKAVYCHRAYLTVCRVYHVKCQAGWSTSWNQDWQEKYQ